jgi:hypothetical protein
MRNTLFASLLLAIPMIAASQQSGLMLNDLKAQNAIQLTVDELRQLLPGANMSRRTNAGSTHRWTNEPGGQMIVSSDGTGRFQGSGRGGTGKGTWHIGDNGTYCVTIEWNRSSDNWCRYLFRLGDKYYGVNSVANGTAPAMEFEISK